MKHLLKKILTPIIERRLVLSLLSFAAGLPSLPALAQEAAQVTAPAQTEQLPAGFTASGAGQGRERIYFEHFWNDFAADRTKSVPEADRQFYAAAYARDDGMRAGFEYFKNFEQDAKDFAELSTTKLNMPFLVLTGEKASGTFLIDQAKLVATNVSGTVVQGSGHWLMEEAPGQVIPAIVAFLNNE